MLAWRHLMRRYLLPVVFALAACGKDPVSPGSQSAELTQLPRQLTGAEHGIIDASNAFSFALFNRVAAVERGTNVFLSPLSASFALGMTMNGAAGQTYDETRSALQF